MFDSLCFFGWRNLTEVGSTRIKVTPRKMRIFLGSPWIFGSNVNFVNFNSNIYIYIYTYNYMYIYIQQYQ